MSQKGPSAAPPSGQQTDRSQSLAGCLVQQAWGIGGFGMLVILWVTIMRGPRWNFTVKDVLYWAVVLGMIAARHVDVARYHGGTTTGGPATARTVPLYALGLLGATGLFWCIAQTFDV